MIQIKVGELYSFAIFFFAAATNEKGRGVTEGRQSRVQTPHLAGVANGVRICPLCGREEQEGRRRRRLCLSISENSSVRPLLYQAGAISIFAFGEVMISENCD